MFSSTRGARVVQPLAPLRRENSHESKRAIAQTSSGWTSQYVFDALYRIWLKSRLVSVKAIPSYPSNASLKDQINLPCHHTHHDADCIVYVFKGLARGLMVGYCLKASFSIAISLFSRRMLRR